jgi:hypothetical protein
MKEGNFYIGVQINDDGSDIVAIATPSGEDPHPETFARAAIKMMALVALTSDLGFEGAIA